MTHRHYVKINKLINNLIFLIIHKNNITCSYLFVIDNVILKKSEHFYFVLFFSFLWPRPSQGYELSLGTSLAKVGRDGCKVFDVQRKSVQCYFLNFIYCIFVFLFIFIINQGKLRKML